MLCICRAAALLILGLAAITHAWHPVILADTNRDGKVDVDDAPDKKILGDLFGAMFLANIGDSNQRCSSLLNWTQINHKHGPDETLDKCNDASDNVQRNPKYLAPLKTLPMSDLGNFAKGSVSVVQAEAAKMVRIFHRVDNDWVYVTSNYTFAADDMREGLELGIDARDVRRPGGWNGEAVVRFRVWDGSTRRQDSVSLRVAPVLTQHHLQPLSEVLLSEHGISSVGSNFVKNLQNQLHVAGVNHSIPSFPLDAHIRDSFIPGFTSMHGPDGPVVLRVMIAPADKRLDGKRIFQHLRSDSIAAVQHLQRDVLDEDMDKGGNIGTIPPYAGQNNSYPAGRIIMGSTGGVKPNIHPFFEAQEFQRPLVVDTTWLYNGTVDAFIQFLPAQNERGWVMMVDDPQAGLQVLNSLKNDGYGNISALSRPSFCTVANDGPYKNRTLPDLTVDELLNWDRFSDVQKNTYKRIETNLKIIQEATELPNDDIYRVPALYYDKSMIDQHPQQPVRHLPKEDEGAQQLQYLSTSFRVYPIYPAAMSGIMLNHTHYLAPNPRGPVVNGTDMLQEAISAAYDRVNVTVAYIDDCFSHGGIGQTRAGMNALRDVSMPWYWWW